MQGVIVRDESLLVIVPVTSKFSIIKCIFSLVLVNQNTGLCKTSTISYNTFVLQGYSEILVGFLMDCKSFSSGN